MDVNRDYQRDESAINNLANRCKPHELKVLQAITPEGIDMHPTAQFAKIDALFTSDRKRLLLEFECSKPQRFSDPKLLTKKLPYGFNIIGRKDPMNWDVILKQFCIFTHNVFVWLYTDKVDWSKIETKEHKRRTMSFSTCETFNPVPWNLLVDGTVGFITEDLERVKEEVSRALR